MKGYSDVGQCVTLGLYFIIIVCDRKDGPRISMDETHRHSGLFVAQLLPPITALVCLHPPLTDTVFDCETLEPAKDHNKEHRAAVKVQYSLTSFM